jgi:arylesterase/paraoxonase
VSRRRVLLLAAAALAAVLLIADLRGRLGPSGPVESSGLEACARLDAPAGPEDLQIDHETGLAVIAAHDRRAANAQGGLHLLDLARPDGQIRPLPHDGPADFRPHGLSLFRRDGVLHVLVVNHPAEGHTIEAFRIETGAAPRAVHVATFAGDALVSPNDVVAAGPDAFYVSNDHGLRAEWLRPLEDLLGLSLGTVVLHDGRRFVPVVPGRRMANGVTLARGGDLVVAETLGRRVVRFPREPGSGRVDLEAPSVVEVPTGPDNLDLAPDGSLWFAAHPSLWAFLGHARDPEVRAPWEVWRLADGRAERVLAGDGSRLSAASVAAARGRTLLVGAVFDGALLRCTLPPALAPGP